MHESLRQFHPVIGRWFEERVGVPTPPQVLGWPVVGAGKSALILAPTGSGKTLAAFLAGIDWLARRLMAMEERGGSLWGVQILYVSPLKSLANDVQKNLMKPLAELAEMAHSIGIEWPEIQVGVRTGDTPQKERAAMVRRPPHILITTPESLNLLLTTGGRAGLATSRFVIVDEVHALAGSKRGVFLSLVLERLEEERQHEDTKTRRTTKAEKSVGGVKIAPGVYVGREDVGPLVRIGLSATARPEELIGNWLAGCDDAGNFRPMAIVRSGQRKRLDLGVVCPFGGDEPEPQPLTVEERKEKGVGHWPEVTRAVLRLIREHHSTLVFANSRRLIERLAARFQEELLTEAAFHEKHPESTLPRVPLILPHHGSISKEVRLETEQALKRGDLDAVLATSSLELGIDVGALDLVVQVDSPGNVAGALQRVGRAGHLEKATAKGRLLARTLQELPSFAAMVPLMFAGMVEETRVPENCLDVLSQQVVAACVARPWKRGDLYRVLRRAMPYRSLTEKQFDTVVAMLSKRAERVTSQGLRPRLSFDRVNDELILMPGAAKVLLMNSGVISDTGQFPVYLAGATRGKVETGDRGNNGQKEKIDGGSPGVRLGELDEEFVYETAEGDRIILGSQTWKVVRIDADRVLVEAAAPGSSRMPFWRGEQPPRSELLGEAVAAFHGEMERRLGTDGKESVREWLIRDHHFDDQAAENASGYYQRQLASAGVPTIQRIVVEHFVDRTGEPIIAILSPLGTRVNYALRLALEQQFSQRRLPAQLVHNDDGLLIRPPVEVGEIPDNPLAWLRAATLEQEITDQLENTALFGLRFRQNAARALMLPRMNVTQRTPLWQQRLRGRHLLALVKKQRNFPIIVETYRECLQDVLGIERVAKLLHSIEQGQISVSVMRNTEPSPFARALHSQFQAKYMYAQDDPLQQASTEPAIDQTVLDDILQRRNSLGTTLETPTWTPADEDVLHRRITGTDYPARTPEELLEKIEAAGAAGVAYGMADDPQWQGWIVGNVAEVGQMLEALSSRRRVIVVGDKHDATRQWVAVDNLATLITARGDMPRLAVLDTGKIRPIEWSEIPPALLETSLSRDAAQRILVEQLVKRQPVTTIKSVVQELPWMAREATAIVAELLREGLVQDIGDGRLAWKEFVDQLRSIALRRERKAAATADVAALQRHLLRWQYIDAPRAGVESLEDVLDMLIGVSAPLSVWEHDILPARLVGFSPAMLDGICRTGRRVWVGGGDGEQIHAVAFWPRHLLSERSVPTVSDPASLSPLAAKVLDFLKTNGASFLVDLQITLTLDDGETALALEELLQRGLISNDHLESLRDVQRLAENARRTRSHREVAARLATKDSRYGSAIGTRSPRRIANGWWRTREAADLGGRWFLLQPAVKRKGEHAALDLAEHAADRVERLLRRTAFACRELIDPAIDGTWRECYDVLTRMEWAGTVRRGYFVEGITGSQFALPTVHLDARSEPHQVVWLSMVDPANVWARVSTRWLSDSGEPARVARMQGNWIALLDGRPVLAAVNWGQRLIPLPAPWDQQALALKSLSTLLTRIPRADRPHLEVHHWDQRDIIGSPAEPILREQSFGRDTQGLRLYRQYSAKPSAEKAP